MSTLLDSLRRAKQVDAAVPHASGAGRQVEVILSTLGYAPRQRWKRVLRLGVGGVAVALVALLGWVMWERSASMSPDMQVASDVSTADVGVIVEGPGTTGGAGGPAPVESESRGDALVPRLVGTGADPSSTPAEPPTAQSPAGATTDPVDAMGTVQPRPVELLDPPPGPTIERGPVVTEVFAMALMLQRGGDIAGAIAEYETLLVEGTLSPQVPNNMGLLYQEQNRFADAAREFQRTIAIDPRYSKAYNNLGVVRMRQVRHRDAAAAFRDARRLDSTNLDAWVNLALALQATGDLAAARRTLVDALSVDARHAPTHYNPARSFELGGDGTRAVEHYGRFLENSGAEHADLVELVSSRIDELNGRVRR